MNYMKKREKGKVYMSPQSKKRENSLAKLGVLQSESKRNRT
jgi:hypothetical protein